MRQTTIAAGLSILAALAAVVAFLAIDAASVQVPAGNNGAGYVSDPVLGFDIAGRSLPDRADIVAIGCSQTYGTGVRPDQTFVALAAGGASVVNLAVPSYGGAGSLAMLELHQSLRPRVVVYGLWAEHRTRNVMPCVESAIPLCIQRPVVAPGYELQRPRDASGMNLALRWVSLAGGSYIDRMQASWLALIDRLSRPSASPVDPVEAEAFLLRRMAADSRAIGARLVVVYLPDYTRGWPATPPEYAALAQREGFTFIDTTAALRPLGDRVAIPGDGHLSIEAHAAIAALISAMVYRRDH